MASMSPNSRSLCQNGCLCTQLPPVLHSLYSKFSGLLSGGSPCQRHGAHSPAQGQDALAPVLRAHVLVLRISKLAQVQQFGGLVCGWVLWTRMESIWGNRCALLRDKACSGWCPCCHWRRGSLNIGNSQQWLSILWARLVIGVTI